MLNINGQKGVWIYIQWHISGTEAPNEQKAGKLLFPLGYHQVRVLCKYRGDGGGGAETEGGLSLSAISSPARQIDRKLKM